MKKELDDKYVENNIYIGLLIKGFYILFFGMVIIGFLYIIFKTDKAFVYGGVLTLVILLIYVLYQKKNKSLDNWYLSKEVLVSTERHDNDDNGGPTLYYVILFDNKILRINNDEACYGDIIYVVRNKKKNYPIFYFFDKHSHYSGILNTIDNTSKYDGKPFTDQYFGGLPKQVTTDTHKFEKGCFRVKGNFK